MILIYKEFSVFHCAPMVKAKEISVPYTLRTCKVFFSFFPRVIRKPGGVRKSSIEDLGLLLELSVFDISGCPEGLGCLFVLASFGFFDQKSLYSQEIYNSSFRPLGFIKNSDHLMQNENRNRYSSVYLLKRN